jgi:ABC-type lipoprotein export system ATPase subunit
MVTHDPATTQYARRTLHLEKGRLVSDQPASERPPVGTESRTEAVA